MMGARVIKTASQALGRRPGLRMQKKIQDHWLRNTLKYARSRSPFYRRRFDETGLDVHTIRRVEDLPALGFFTTASELQNDPEAFLAVPESEILHVMATAGSTGTPKMTYYSARDWDSLVRKLEIGFVLIGLGKRDVAQLLVCTGTPGWMGGTLLQAGLEKRGCRILAGGNTLDPEEQLALAKSRGTTYLFGTAGALHRLTVEGNRLMDLSGLEVERIYVFAEPNSREFRAFLRESWGAEVFDGYGMNEFGAAVAGECPAHNGLHLDLSILAEVVAPDSGEPVSPGEWGELVFTSLNREATPLIRYRTGDIGRLLPDECCPCGLLPTRRMDHISGRKDDMLFLGTGENFYPALLDRAVVAFPVISGWQLIVGRSGYLDTLRLRIETGSASEGLAAAVREELYRAIPTLEHDVHLSRTVDVPEIEFLKPGALADENPIKIRKIVDLRHKKRGGGR